MPAELSLNIDTMDDWRAAEAHFAKKAPVLRFTKRIKSWSKLAAAIRLPILAGPLRGKMWSPASRGKLLRIFLGTYEPDLTQHLVGRVKEGDVVFDVGANVGYYTLLCSVLTGARGRVVSFEPAPDVAWFCRKHVRINRLQNALVLQTAIGDAEGVVTFETRNGSGRGRVSETGDIQAPVRRIDDVAAELNLLPNYIKIDVEGYGYQVLCGAKTIIRRARPEIILSTHGQRERQLTTELMSEMGYTVSRCGPDLVFHPSPAAAIARNAA
jgi:FkbM family methyltransferase